MPQQFSSSQSQISSPCYNPNSMDEYNPIDYGRRSTQAPRGKAGIKMNPVLWGLLGIFMITLCATVYLTYTVVQNATAARIKQTTQPELSITGAPQANQPEVNVNTPLQAEDGPTPIPWDGANRVTMLVMGMGSCNPVCDPWYVTQSDTMMLLTMDPVSRTAGILSIPRDLWVNVPGFDYGKIATANFIGEVYHLPGGGPGLAIQTVEQLLGVDINYYAVLDFSAFEEFINEIGGVTVDVPYEQTVDPLGPGNTVTLPQGVQHLDGPTALAYSRNRSIGNDYARMDNQQQVVMAIRDQILSLGTLPKLIANAPTIYNNLHNGIRSNLSLKEVLSLAWTAAQIPPENIKRAVIGPNEVTDSWSADGQEISLPDMEAIRAIRDQVFSTTSGEAPIATVYISNPEELRLAEGATVTVLNATTTAGLASDTSAFLESKGISVMETGNAEEKSDTTVIIDYTGKPYTVQFLVELLNIQPNSIYSRYDPNSQTDIAILLGADWAENNSMP